MNDELDDLDTLQRHPGWLRFVAQVREQWGPAGYGLRLKLAVVEARRNNSDLVIAIARVDAANDAVNELLSWPGSRVTSLMAEAAREHGVAPLSRRGPGC